MVFYKQLVFKKRDKGQRRPLGGREYMSLCRGQGVDSVLGATKMQRKTYKSQCREHFPVNTGEQLAMGTKTILKIKLVFFSLSTIQW